MFALRSIDKSLPRNQRELFVGELADVHAGGFVRFFQATLEEMWQLVEFAELPLSVRRVAPTAHVRRVVVILL